MGNCTAVTMNDLYSFKLENLANIRKGYRKRDPREEYGESYNYATGSTCTAKALYRSYKDNVAF